MASHPHASRKFYKVAPKDFGHMHVHLGFKLGIPYLNISRHFPVALARLILRVIGLQFLNLDYKGTIKYPWISEICAWNLRALSDATSMVVQ